ncbi:hypothetical protein [Streptosporangium roseum]|uniref:Polysaccharide chain length determinant N-terminal domain-containing protein n=1 Tax=Streptosporangium roseum (strain ATCC 12428 / DSM 43021 / JCM 3005 / KCTC 9067 / NCIMB 10171 / NRRL 2505 / NI 9100) TaxID=479432 RepID=D2B4I2_STRRD|nr:hypothetical protein [Streptosporangium roseum]ACZ83668.1 hypothetical protein Sros_0645 [Streptosporangium roseum DSM 43021]
MDFWKAIFGLVKRRLIGPPLAALALAAATLVFFLMPTTYVSTASMVLTTPATGGTLPSDPTKPLGLTNPLLQFSDGLRVTAGILILSMNAPEVAAELGVLPNSTTEITINDGRTNPNLLGISTNGPFVYVEVQSRSAATAQDVVVKAKQRVRRELINRQQALKAPRSTFISIVDVVPSSTPEAKLSGKLTAAGGTLFLVFLVGIGIAYGMTQMRQGGRSADPARPSDGGGGPKDDHPEAAALSAGGAVAAPLTAYPRMDTREPAEGPFQDDSEPLVVVIENEPFMHRDDDAGDTIVFMRASGRDDHEK